MAMLYSVNQSSACLLVEFAQTMWLGAEASPSLINQQRYLIIPDLYIKARSYCIINKVAFWFALLTGVAVVVWPAIAILRRILAGRKSFLNPLLCRPRSPHLLG